MKPIGLIDGDALRKEYLLAGKNKLSLAAAINRLEMMPTLHPVDAVIVVRCKDCAHQECCAGADDLDMSRSWLWCNHWGEEVEQDGFCKWGDERGGKENAEL